MEMIFRLIIICLAFVCCTFGDEELDKKAEELKRTQQDLRAARSKLDMDSYRKNFKIKRNQQIAAVKSILQLNNYAKQFDVVDKVTEKMFWVLEEARTVLTKDGYSPGDQFPLDKEVRNALALVLENTALFGDILLRLPDITHQLLRRSKERQLLIKWSISICNASEVYDQTGKKLLHLVAQELKLIPKDENYVNPYKLEAQIDKEFEKTRPKTEKERKKEQKKKKKRGPRLSDEL